MDRCSVCKDWGIHPNPHIHIEEEVEGLLETTDLEKSQITRIAEQTPFEDGVIVYRYVWSPADLFKISSSQSIASIARCYCIKCLNYSLSFSPHYGDGAYCTVNDHLKQEDRKVIQTHGIYIREMNYRVVLKIKNVGTFTKIQKTAGVVRSTPVGQQLFVDGLVFSEQLKIICFQQWDGNKWLDVLLEELKGVS